MNQQIQQRPSPYEIAKELLEVDDRPCLYVSRFAVRPDLQGNGLGLFLLNLAE